MVDKQNALEILDAEAKRRIDDIRQRIEFICTSLRVHGNMQINQLLASVRKLTMREFCHRYGADTAKFLAEQTRLRRQAAPNISVTPQKRRLEEDEQEQQPRKSKLRALERLQRPEPKAKEPATITQPEPAKERPATPEPTTTTTKEQRSKENAKEHVNKRQLDTHPEPAKERLQRPEPTTTTKDQRSKAQAKEPANKRQLDTQPESAKRKTPQVIKNDDDEEEEEEEEEEFGPVLVHLERPQHPRITLKLDPQHSVDQLGHFELNAPIELLERMGTQQQRRLLEQIKDIEAQLGVLKRALMIQQQQQQKK